MDQIRDPALYRRLSEPYTSEEEANEAMDGFLKEMRTIREKWRIPEVHVAMGCNVTTDGEESVIMATSSHGDPNRAAIFFGAAFRQARESMEKALERTVGK